MLFSALAPIALVHSSMAENDVKHKTLQNKRNGASLDDTDFLASTYRHQCKFTSFARKFYAK